MNYRMFANEKTNPPGTQPFSKSEIRDIEENIALKLPMDTIAADLGYTVHGIGQALRRHGHTELGTKFEVYANEMNKAKRSEQARARWPEQSAKRRAKREAARAAR